MKIININTFSFLFIISVSLITKNHIPEIGRIFIENLTRRMRPLPPISQIIILFITTNGKFYLRQKYISKYLTCTSGMKR